MVQGNIEIHQSAGAWAAANIIWNQFKQQNVFDLGVFNVPFLDPMTAMLGEFPLTTTEYEEWGNPNESETDFKNILKTSPYCQLIQATESSNTSTPSIYVSTSLKDQRVPYWHALKWVKAARSKYPNIDLFFRVEENYGHEGSIDSVSDCLTFCLSRLK